jgi:ribosome-binding protein aMBF1 (putative translation factor)
LEEVSDADAEADADAPASASRRAAEATTLPDGFAAFWATCPRQEGRAEAIEAYRQVVDSATATSDQLIDAMRRYADAKRHIEQKYIKLPRNWLAGECWLENPLPPKSKRAPEPPKAAPSDKSAKPAPEPKPTEKPTRAPKAKPAKAAKREKTGIKSAPKMRFGVGDHVDVQVFKIGLAIVTDINKADGQVEIRFDGDRRQWIQQDGCTLVKAWSNEFDIGDAVRCELHGDGKIIRWAVNGDAEVEFGTRKQTISPRRLERAPRSEQPEPVGRSAFAQHVESERTRRGWSRQELAARIRLDECGVENIETGRAQASPTIKKRIDAAFDAPDASLSSSDSAGDRSKPSTPAAGPPSKPETHIDPAQRSSRARAFDTGDYVKHPEFGTGIVCDAEDDEITVQFNRKVGYRVVPPSAVEPGVEAEVIP